ncbi:septum formation inhibitor Maf [Anaerobacillus alkalidiazotrophicus]|uniref:dTTP/UTP pyrophosphatase n=1 Tax=Anaerobacillus alkalidiazotrophicus TaxID=472963 RepID=A0A1S2M375_9BACI|nr:Maf family protein [Anaerobacillus alkalidiazotrophicus]OIJ18377.1 septum formation inhibitor Maf [Anaerobacillus alkalidiazotrophicus]OIJ19856.1 septum formation inhibitor Maf [Anaerobacillus alkalidiazotrophicus]
MKKLILASGSPRRKQLLEQGKLEFSISTSTVDENVDETTPNEVVEELAMRKAKDVLLRHDDSIIIGADTIVSINGQILGKPNNETEATEMLQLLSGNDHDVYTGVAILSKEKTVLFHEKTVVSFWELTNEEIFQYIASGEPFDKAGSYGIQGLGALFVKKIHGDYFTVVGLPLARTIRELKTFEV